MTRRGIAFGLTVGIAALAALIPGAAGAAGTGRATCAHQSGATFAADADDLVVGPLRFVGLRAIADVDASNLVQHGGWKSPAVLRAGHVATVSVDRAARSRVRLDYLHTGSDAFAALPHTVRFVACGRGRSMSTLDGKPVTFWSGFFRTTSTTPTPGCLPLTFRIDGGPPRHRRLPVAGGSCDRR